jgi:hypothetical protein
MVKQARDAEQQVTDDKAKNKEEAKEVKEAKEGRLEVRECPDVQKGDTKDKFFCFEELAGDQFFDKTVSEWGDSLTKQVKIEIDGELKEVAIEVEVWPECEGVNTPCGKTTDKNTEYFTRDGKYFLVREEKGEKKTADDSKDKDGKGKETPTYEKLEILKYTEVIEETIAKCEESDSGICKLVSNPNFTEVMQGIIEEEAKAAANEEEKKLDEERKQMEAERARKVQEETQRIQREILELEEEKEYEALKKNEQELIIEENEQELIEGQRRLINLEKYGA